MVRSRISSKESLSEKADRFNTWCIEKYGQATKKMINICFQHSMSQSTKNYARLVENGVSIWEDKYCTPATVTSRRRRPPKDAPRRRRRA